MIVSGALAAAGACSGDDPAVVDAVGDAVLLTVAGPRVIAHSLRAGRGQQVIVDDLDEGDEVPGAARGVCVIPDGSRRFLVAERGRPDGGPTGWSLYRLEGDGVGRFSAELVHRLVGAGGAPGSVPTGCAFLGDGRLLTATHAGGGVPGGLTVWFPPFDVAPVRRCAVDGTVVAPQAVHVGRADAVFVASSAGPTAGVVRYSGTFPTGDDDGCGDPLTPDLFLPPDEDLPAADALAPAPDGGLYVASALAGRVVQYDRLGRVIRTVLQPEAGGRPLALEPVPGGLAFADGATGSVRLIAFRSEAPQAPVVMIDGLEEPAGLAVLVIAA